MSDTVTTAAEELTAGLAELRPSDPALALPADLAPVSDQPDLSEAQLRAMAADAIRHGVPQERVEAALQAHGLAPVAQDTRSEGQIAYEAAFGPVPADYRVEYVNRLPPGMTMDGLVEFNTAAGAWLASMSFPAEIGAGVIERVIDTSQRYQRMSETEQTLFQREQVFELQRLAGGEIEGAERLAQARELLARAPQTFTQALYENGALHDAGIVMHLALQGERLAIRE